MMAGTLRTPFFVSTTSKVKRRTMTIAKVQLGICFLLVLSVVNHAFDSSSISLTRRKRRSPFPSVRPINANTVAPIEEFPFNSKTIALSSTNNDADSNQKEPMSDKLVGILVLLTVPLTWGTYVPVVRYLYAIQPPVPGILFSACYYTLAAVTTSALVFWQSRKNRFKHEADQLEVSESEQSIQNTWPVRGGIELGSYLFIANCLQIIGLRSVESDRAGFLVQLTTVMVPFVEALFAGNLVTVPVRTWLACVFAFSGLFVMGLDGKVVGDPVSTFVTALSSFTQGDFLIIGAAVLYTLHVVRLGTYARETTPMKLAASKATAETIFSILLVIGLVGLAPLAGTQTGLLGFAAETGNEIVTFVSSFREGLANGSLPQSVLFPAIAAVFWTGWITCAYTIYAQSFGQSRVRYVT
jgi:hypothetical protein